jgi:hypothetical protein
MSGNISKNKFKFKFRRTSEDPLDVGFDIEGYKIRWIRAERTEDKIHRIWRPLQKTDLPEETLKELESQRFGLWSGGNTIRRGDLVLAYAPMEAVMAYRKEIQERNNALQNLVRSAPKGIPGAKVEYKAETFSSSREDFE